MEITGSSTIRYVDVTGKQPLEFRLNQRITAEVLNVSGDQVDLSIRGTRVVGKLISGTIASALTDQRTAQFIVKGMANGMLQLQVITPQVTTPPPPTGIAAQWSILAQNLLQLNGLDLTNENMVIGRALLSLGLPITPELLENAKSALNGLGRWGQPEADLAAALLSNGFPLSTGTLNLALLQLPSLVDAYQHLAERLAQYQKGNIPNDLRMLIQQSLSTLNQATLRVGEGSAEIIKQLTQAISLWGKSIESHLADLALRNGTGGLLDTENVNGLLVLVHLRRALSQRGDIGLVNEIDRFMDSIRQMQFNNTSQKNDPTNPSWLVIDLPISGWLQKAAEKQMNPANLRIAYRSDEEGKTIDPDNNRLVLSIDLDEKNVIEVDLSMVGKRVGAWLTVSTDEWRLLVEDELPSLKEGLEKLGYAMQFARCEVKQARPGLGSEVPATKIDLEA